MSLVPTGIASAAQPQQKAWPSGHRNRTVCDMSGDPSSVVLFDGACVFCRRSAERLRRWIGHDQDVSFRSFRDPGVLAIAPDLTEAECERALQLVEPDGRVYPGAEAIARLLARRPLGKLALAYYLPGLRQLIDVAYAWVARNRFRLRGRDDCDGTCQLHQ